MYDFNTLPISALYMRWRCLKVKIELPLAIFNYGIEADFTNPVVQEARGIIINLDTLDVVFLSNSFSWKNDPLSASNPLYSGVF